MHKIRRGCYGEKIHYVYTIKEAVELGIEFDHFREKDEWRKGEWIQSSDGYVVEILSAYKIKRANNEFMYSTVGGTFSTGTRTYNVDPENIKPPTFLMTKRDKFIIDMWLTGVPMDQAYKSVSSAKNIATLINHMIKKKGVHEYIMQGLEEKLDKYGASKEVIVKELLSVAQDKTATASSRVKALELLGKYQGMGIETKRINEITEKRIVRFTRKEMRELEAVRKEKLSGIEVVPALGGGEIDGNSSSD